MALCTHLVILPQRPSEGSAFPRMKLSHRHEALAQGHPDGRLVSQVFELGLTPPPTPSSAPPQPEGPRCPGRP